jgi:hypothetical protein
LTVPSGRHEWIAHTLPFPLHAGRWRVAVDLASGSWDDVTDLTVSIVAPGDHHVHELRLADAERNGDRLVWRVEQPYLLFALTLALSVETSNSLVVAPPLDVTCEGSAS